MTGCDDKVQIHGVVLELWLLLVLFAHLTMMFFDINAGAHITLIGAPIWLWATDDLIVGEYRVPATAFNVQSHKPFTDHALLGLIPLSRLLPRTTSRPISL